MRYCYQTATFYLSTPGRRGRSARLLEGIGGISNRWPPQSKEARSLYHAPAAPIAIARLSYRA